MPPNEEQLQETTPSVEPTTPAHATRDDLIAAVRAAGGVESVVDDTPTAEPTTPAATEPATETPAAPEESRVDRLLREREERHKELSTRQSRARDIEEEARRNADQIMRDAQAKAQKLIDDQIAEHRAKFNASPTAALRTLGLDSQTAIDAVLAEGTPQARALAEANQRASKAEEKAEQATQSVAEFQKWKASTEDAAKKASYDQYIQTFLTTHASAEKAPYLNARYEPEQIRESAVKLATDWAQGGLIYAKDGAKSQYEFDDSDVVAYLEKQSKERVAKLAPLTTPAAQQVSAAAPATGPGNAPKVSANGPRTLSAAPGSERRSSPTPFNQLNAAQKRQALIDEVAAERRRNPDALD